MKGLLIILAFSLTAASLLMSMLMGDRTANVRSRSLVNQKRQDSASSAVRTDKWGNIYLVDRGNNRIVKFDGEGSFLQEIGGAG